MKYKLKDISIRIQLLIGFTILILIVVALGGAMLSFSVQTKGNITTLVDVTAPLTAKSMSLIDEIGNFDLIIMAILRLEDEKQIQLKSADFEKSKQRIFDTIDQLKEIIEGRETVEIDIENLNTI